MTMRSLVIDKSMSKYGPLGQSRSKTSRLTILPQNASRKSSVAHFSNDIEEDEEMESSQIEQSSDDQSESVSYDEDGNYEAPDLPEYDSDNPRP